MKFSVNYFLFVCHLMITITAVKANEYSVPEHKIRKTILIEKTDTYSVVAIERKDDVLLFNVIAAVGVNFLPETVRGICIKTTGDPDQCEAIYDVSSAIVSLAGPGIYKGFTNAIRWIAKRNRNEGIAIVEAKTYTMVSALKKIFQAYNSLGCMKWRSVSSDESSYDFCYCKDKVNSIVEWPNETGYQIDIRNHTNQTIPFSISANGGDSWKKKSLRNNHVFILSCAINFSILIRIESSSGAVTRKLYPANRGQDEFSLSGKEYEIRWDASADKWVVKNY